MHNYPEDKLERIAPSHPLFLGIVGNPHVSIKLYSEENPQKTGFNFHRSLQPVVNDGARNVSFYPINVAEKVKKAYKKSKKASSLTPGAEPQDSAGGLHEPSRYY